MKTFINKEFKQAFVRAHRQEPRMKFVTSTPHITINLGGRGIWTRTREEPEEC